MYPDNLRRREREPKMTLGRALPVVLPQRLGLGTTAPHSAAIPHRRAPHEHLHDDPHDTDEPKRLTKRGQPHDCGEPGCAYAVPRRKMRRLVGVLVGDHRERAEQDERCAEAHRDLVALQPCGFGPRLRGRLQRQDACAGVSGVARACVQEGTCRR